MSAPQPWGWRLNSRGGADCLGEMCFGELDSKGNQVAAHREHCLTSCYENLREVVKDVVQVLGMVAR